MKNQSKIQLGVILAVISAIASAAYFIGALENRVSQLEKTIEELKKTKTIAASNPVQTKAGDHAAQEIADNSSPKDGPEPTPIDMDRPEVDNTTPEKPFPVHSPIQVKWGGEPQRRVVQVYREGQLIFPRDNPREEQLPGGPVISLDPAMYEIKIWAPGTKNFKNAWIEIIE